MKKFSVVKKFLSGVGVLGIMTAGVGGSVSASSETFFRAEGECKIVMNGNTNAFDRIDCVVGNNTKPLELKDLELTNSSGSTGTQSCPDSKNWTNMGYASLTGAIAAFITIGAAIGAAVMNSFGNK